MNFHSDNRELHALISLLDEPDGQILEKVTDKIYSYGISAIPLLENAWEHIPDSMIQQRIESIIHKVQYDQLYSELSLWSLSGYTDLLKGYMLVTRHRYPMLEETKILKHINEIRQDVWLELNNDLTALEKVKVINHILYDIHQFTGNKQKPASPKNSYIHTVLETHKGNPLSLGILYLIVAQSQGIPVYGINLPQHFVLAFANEMVENGTKMVDETDILFYINPFNRGTVFTRREIELFIKQMNLKPEKSFYYPCDNLTIIRRLIHYLKDMYENMGEPEKARELDDLEAALD